MSEIEVGEYIRTEKGLIAKTIGFDDDNNFLLDNQQIITKIESKKIKHSKNIIDLIEVGDYVNGKYVYDVFENANREKVIKIDCMRGYLYQYEIKSIITKEQIAQIEYKVGE